jgi:excisionase family DNA binding protein
MNERRWLSATEAAAYLSLKISTFRTKVRNGAIPPGSAALGPRSVRWSTDQLDAFMSGESAAPTPSELIHDFIASGGLKPSRKRRRRKPPGGKK